MTRYTKSALKKIKKANLTILEAESLANWFAQTVATYAREIGGISTEDFFSAQNEITVLLKKGAE